MTETEQLLVYPRANIFLVSNVQRQGHVGLMTGANGRKPFLNPWDEPDSWDRRMKGGREDCDFGMSSVTLEDQHSGSGIPRDLLQVEETGTVTDSEVTVEVHASQCETTPSAIPGDGLTSTLPGKDCLTGPQTEGKVNAAVYNLRSRPAPYEVPQREPGLHGLGFTMSKSRSRSEKRSVHIPPLCASFVSGGANIPEALRNDEQQAVADQHHQSGSGGTLPPTPMDEDVVAAVQLSTSEYQAKDAIERGDIVVGRPGGEIYIVKTSSSITTAIAEQYVVRYQQIMLERSTSGS